MLIQPDRIVRPRFYPILDVGLLSARGWSLSAFAQALHAANVSWLQYRNKLQSDAQMLEDAATLREIFADAPTKLILNDRADLVGRAGFHGVHVGQQDIAPAIARAIVGKQGIVGVSTHTPEQVVAADANDCDYIAYGPIFTTGSKENPDPVVGLEGLRQARLATTKHLVAIGGITRSNCRSVIDAGADAVAVISELVPPYSPDPAESVQRIVEEFLAQLT